jgi:hypothetical protein
MKRRQGWIAGWLLLGMLAAAGCESDAEAACKRAQECGLLEGSLDECVSELEKNIPSGRLSECADCVDDHQCSAIKHACDDSCDEG